MTRSTFKLALALAFALALAGCDGAPMPSDMVKEPHYEKQYPPKPDFSAEEIEAIASFRATKAGKAAWDKAQRTANAWREIVHKHDAWARAKNLERLKGMGFDEEDVRDAYGIAGEAKEPKP